MPHSLLDVGSSQEQPFESANGVDLDSTLVTKPKVHVVMTANHVNPKLYLNSRKRRFLRFSCLMQLTVSDKVPVPR